MDFILGKGFRGNKAGSCTRDGMHEPDVDISLSNNRLDEYPSGMGLRSGFMSLKERFANLSKQSEHQTLEQKQKSTEASPQFANLQEFFSSRHHYKQQQQDQDEHGLRKTKIPIMRLRKDDWNVRCWEERLNSHKKRYSKHRNLSNHHADSGDKSNEPKPKLQVEVFNDRISDVANKLDKVREGMPQDEMLYQLASNRLTSKKVEPTKEWTSLLKDELSRGAHNPKILEAQYASIGKKQQAVNAESRKKEYVKSPIGRYIGRIDDDDSEDDYPNAARVDH